MKMSRSTSQRRQGHRGFLALVLSASLAGCSTVALDPTPVVPAKTSLSYSAKVKLEEVAAFMVEPGASMLADPHLQNHVTGLESGFEKNRAQWEKSILEYLAARRTFRQVTQGGRADLDLTVRVIIYIDPGIQYKFNYIYVARTDATLSDPKSARPLISYSGTGKAAGEVSRGGKSDDEGPINRAVHAALNDMFSKLEGDKRLAEL